MQDSSPQACPARSTLSDPARDAKADDLGHKEDFGRQLSSVSTSPELEQAGHSRQVTEFSDVTARPWSAEEGPKTVLPAEGQWQIPEHFARARAPPKVTSDVRIAILVVGTREDIQPCVALACELQTRGHRAALFTNHDLLGFSRAAGVEAVPAFPSVRAILAQTGGFPVGAEQASVERQLWKNVMDPENHRAAKAWLEANPGLVQEPLRALAAFRPSLLLCTLASQHTALAYSAKHGVPALPVYNTTAAGAFHTPKCPPVPSLFAVSPAVDVQPPGCGSADIVTGPWLLQEDEERVAEAAVACGLQRFLEAGERPVIVSWGSLALRGFPPAAMLDLALRALAQTGKRGVVLGGSAKLHEAAQSLGPEQAFLAAYAAEKVFFAPHFPHSWLLPRGCCLVHKGGSGTTQAALLAGCPQVVTPAGSYHFHFARRVTELEAGVGLMSPLPKVSAAALASAITRAQAMRPSRYIAVRLRNERGVETAADLAEVFLEEEVATGAYARRWRAEQQQEKPGSETGSRR